jgi:AcrR family transcriptional regulator
MRSRILEAAARAIAAHGFHGMSMRELARAAGMSLSNLYNYFASKDEILHALQKEAFEVLVGSAEGALAELDAAAGPESRLYVFVSHHVRYVAERPEVMRVLVHEAASLPPARRRSVRRLKERYFRLARGIVAEVVAGGCGRAVPLAGAPAAASTNGGPSGPTSGPTSGQAELDRITYNLFGMLNWIYGWYEPPRHGTPAELARTIHRIALCGIVGQCPYREDRDLQESLDHLVASLDSPPLLGATAGGAGGGHPS